MNAPKLSLIAARLLLVALVIVPVAEQSYGGDLEAHTVSESSSREKSMVSVYTAMSLESRVVDVIDRETVQIQYEIMGSDQAWCGVGRQPGTPLLGFVPCAQLAGGLKIHEEWQAIDPAPGARSTGHKQQAAISGNQVTVEAQITRKEETTRASLVLDTGASISVISRDVAQRLALDLKSARKITLNGLGGSVVEAWLVRIDSLLIGPCEKKDLPIAVIDRPVLDGRQDGLLGMDFLKECTYHIDFASHTVEWGVR